MKSVTVYPGSASGVVPAPPSLEEALPAIVLAAITKTSVRAIGSTRDTVSMFNGLFALGAQFRQQDDVVTFYSVPKQSSVKMECTHRVLLLLLPLCAVLGGEYTFLGEFDSHTISAIKHLGIDWSVGEKGVTIKTPPRIGDIALEDETFAAGFMLTLPMMQGSAVLRLGTGTSQKLILKIMHEFGFNISDQDGYTINKQREIDTRYIYSVGGDYGEAALLLLAGFLSGEVGVTGLLAGSLQSGRSVIDDFVGLKLHVQEMNGAVFAKRSRMNEDIIDVSCMAVPSAVLVLACFCKGKCVIKNADRLGPKEQEEFYLIAKELQSIGADIIKIGQEYFITGKKKLFGGNVDAHHNQHAATCLAAAGLCSEIGVTLNNAPPVDALASLGITIQ